MVGSAHGTHGANRPGLAFLYWGRRVRCPCCGGRFRKFLPHGFASKRRNARCPRCQSLERHRLIWLYLQRRTDLLQGSHRLLHIAPERTLRRRLSAVPGLDYVTADLDGRKAMLEMDLTDTRQPDRSYDAILCSHVLEHIPDDRKAMRELWRILRPGGWAIVASPYRSGRPTDEDPSVTDPAERTRRFGQPDHVRYYGSDLPARLRDAGFDVEEVRGDRFLGDEMPYWGVRAEHAIMVCRRAGA